MNSNEPTQDYDRNPFMFSPSQSASGEGEKEGGEKTVKKRTKTGCLTCRLRRIKCDEGKPECNNCKKSKRQCGGYGVRPSRGELLGNEKKSKRFSPYGDKDIIRTYKNIVPAPPKPVEIKLPVAESPKPPTIRAPKRKRDENNQRHQYQERPVTQPPMVNAVSEMSYRSTISSRIPISSLLTFDQAAIAEFVSQQALNTYTPNYYRDSPLTDPVLFEAFRHYIEVVAPTMSLIESSPPNPTILNYRVVPSVKACNLFTYQLPVMAVGGNWAIMEAILAISFLHISHVTRSSKQQAFLHYQLALKRLKMEMSKANAARDLGLLAATLLLSWYELTTGDHVKWVLHMSGAMAVIIELGSSTSAETPETVVGGNDCYSSTNDPAYNSEQHSLEKVRTVTGRPLQISTGRNLLHELFYLYAKMDVIQSLLRASPPLLELSEWRYPLRAPTSTILGLHDALIHLMARLAVFIGSEKERKLALEDNMPPPQPSYRPPQPSPQSSPATSSPWSFARTPSDTAPTPLTPIDTPSPLQDWETLQADFQRWKCAVQELETPRIEPNMPTPFGPALIYKDLRVAAATMLFLASRIHLNRAHPSTPAVPAGAIGMTAQQNGPLVAEIMRIQEGLWDSKNFRTMTISEDGRSVGGEGRTVDFVVSALSNSAWPMLVGGMQVRDEMQRKWLKTRLCDIYELSGFATAMRVRKGLEVAWGQRKRGEPSGFDDLDSDDDTVMSLIAREEKVRERELKQRRQLAADALESRFVLVKGGEDWFSQQFEKNEQVESVHAFGVFKDRKLFACT